MALKALFAVASLAVCAFLASCARAQYVKTSQWSAASGCPSDPPDFVGWTPKGASCPSNFVCISGGSSLAITIDCAVQPVTVPTGSEYILLEAYASDSCAGVPSVSAAYKTGACLLLQGKYTRVTRSGATVTPQGCTSAGCGTCTSSNITLTAGVCLERIKATVYQNGSVYTPDGSTPAPSSIPNVSLNLSPGGTTAPAVRQAAPPSLPAGTRGYSVDQLWTATECTLSDQPPDTLVFRQVDACTGVACSGNAYPYSSTQTACAADGTAPTDATYAVKAYAFFDPTRQCKNPLFAEMYRVGRCLSNVDRSAYVVFSCNTSSVTAVSYDPDDANCTGTAPYAAPRTDTFVTDFCDLANNVAYSCSEAGSATAKFYASAATALAASVWAAAAAALLAAAWAFL